MYIVDLKKVTLQDIALVGGKNASIGEMLQNLVQLGVNVPGGFAVTSKAFDRFITENNLDQWIANRINALNVSDIDQLTTTGKAIRSAIMSAEFSADLSEKIRHAYAQFDQGQDISFAVRSSATAEDLPDASFAGQQETFLNIRGADEVLHAVKQVFASLYNDRAIAYRTHQGFDSMKISISAGVQRMVRSDLASSGVMFTIDTESGFENVIFITASYGLGEMVVQGAVNPDEFYIYKPNIKLKKPAILSRILGTKKLKMVYQTLTQSNSSPVLEMDVSPQDQAKFCVDDADIARLCDDALKIEQHYGCPMDIEWAKDGNTGEIFIVQARPETVRSSQKLQKSYQRYTINSKGFDVLVTGRSIGDKIGAGCVKKINDVSQISQVNEGDVLVTDMTDPDWEPVMKKAAAIVTNRGGRTCHAAIIARELGIPAVVGTGNATELLEANQAVTVSCAQGDAGFVYDGKIDFEIQNIAMGTMPDIGLDVMMNIANPDLAFSLSRLPNAGVGLARLEFIINRVIGIHPRALLEIEKLPEALKQQIMLKAACYKSPRDYFVQKLKDGIATIAASFYPKPVIVRLSDFKSNEYASMIAGSLFEPDEENPMLGFRGASRYLDETFKPCFQMECEAILAVRDTMGFDNIKIMVPFVRTVDEAKGVLALLKQYGLERGKNGLEIFMMCELPSNAVLADAFLEHFDGFSIGSNDMTQLALGLDRDSGLIAYLFDEKNEAVKKMIEMAIDACLAQGKYVGICGQAPSDHLDFACWLLEKKIGSISLNPDTIVQTWYEIDKFLKKEV